MFKEPKDNCGKENNDEYSIPDFSNLSEYICIFSTNPENPAFIQNGIADIEVNETDVTDTYVQRTPNQ